MPPKKTLILSIDGLGSRDVGAYGSTWVETPAFNRIAARSLVFEQTLADSTRIDLALSAMATGAVSGGSASGSPLILEALRQRGAATVLISDASQHFPQPLLVKCFDQVLNVDSGTVERPALDLEETHCAKFFAKLRNARRGLTGEHVCWVHYSGLTTCWDAPVVCRERSIEEGEPEPYRATRPPQGTGKGLESDELIGFRQALAAEILVLDECIGALWDQLENETDVRLVIASPRGYPLGEHRVAGLIQPVMYSEATAIPLMFADPDSPIGLRLQNVVQPSILGEVLRNWHDFGECHGDADAQQNSAGHRSVVVCGSEQGRAIRTADWLLIQAADRDELYVKPDDRWEFNDVSSRCPEVVRQLLEMANPQASPVTVDGSPNG